MNNNNRTVAGITLGFFLVALASIMPAHAQTPPSPLGDKNQRLLGLTTPTGLTVIPIFEGVYENEDGSVTYSFGYLNRNTDEVVETAIGEGNFIEPAEYNGVQPTTFQTGRNTGVFTVTVPASARDGEVWWHIKSGENEILKVPGRRDRLGYTLDRKPRPAGSLAPVIWATEGGPRGTDPMALFVEEVLTVKAGAPLTLTVSAEDLSVRDMTDDRNAKGIPLRAYWSKFQGPIGAEVTFERHPSSPEPEPVTEAAARRGAKPAGPNETKMIGGKGTANVLATFTQPGDYLIRTMVDNWDAIDSTEADQCCWSNMYQKITVTP